MRFLDTAWRVVVGTLGAFGFITSLFVALRISGDQLAMGHMTTETVITGLINFAVAVVSMGAIALACWQPKGKKNEA